jgi:hypothetical protein
VCYAKNFLSPKLTCKLDDFKITYWWHHWEDCSTTGYHKDTPAWLSFFLMVACDNTLHLCINYLSLKWL